MGRVAATAVHLTLSAIAIVLYALFVLPRWWELMGDTSHTLGTVLRIVDGVVFAAASVPVALTLVRTKKPELNTPAIALNLRLSSAIAQAMAGVLILGTAVAEIWVSFDTAGVWLSGIYGVAAALAILGFLGFYVAFVADQPPAPPKVKNDKKDPGTKDTDKKDTAEKTTETDSSESDSAEIDSAEIDSAESDSAESDSAESDSAEPTREATDAESTDPQIADTETTDEPVPVETSESVPVETAEESAEEPSDTPTGLRNKRPSGKSGHRLRRRERTNVAVEE